MRRYTPRTLYKDTPVSWGSVFFLLAIYFSVQFVFALLVGSVFSMIVDGALAVYAIWWLRSTPKTPTK